MKKLATFLTIVSVALAAGVSSLQAGTDVATVQCTTFAPQQKVNAVDASSGIVLPRSCAAGATSCAQCIRDLKSVMFNVTNSFSVQSSTPGYAGPYYLMTR